LNNFVSKVNTFKPNQSRLTGVKSQSKNIDIHARVCVFYIQNN